MDKTQELSLLACEHRAASLGRSAAETNHERTLSVPYVFRKHLI
jgi:hypothetical protein